MSDPYARNMFGTFNPYYAKQPVIGRLVVVLDGTYENRGMELIKPPSRALRQTEIHELIITNEDTQPGSKVNSIAYIGFFEVVQGGVIIVGDQVKIDGKRIGKIAGYDETHMLNHLNIVMNGNKISGKDFHLSVADEVVIG
ncbi:DUF6917 domain-containing protein [Sporomusa acidovorans]|uniref:DUF6917 domain-containing protein n=1 Tax=Sporomusa acidovorans (strain ATCC 49682 / DSM 3132 / Mol) TaxID=1123286 RepID=A0ABZ3J338_SPOA4|nr:hypothetical protein [Sporomusa acidovorans]OZC20294.1 hypothetical protein SPACI_26930 [Sporomusa acidovorans DSM 3132]SDD38968.1 hypothetical protein SAMN04488499_100190 [Sporomusa acidovorans]